MKTFATYGIKCTKKDEKILAQRINAYLATLQRTMSKSTNKSLLSSFLPLVYKYYYWNLNKEVGTWFEIFPNQDLKGNYFNEATPDCAWIIKTRINLTHPLYEKETTEGFLSNVLQAIQFVYIVIEETDVEAK